MAHPNKKEASLATGSKLARMTRHYGAASADNIKPPVEKYKSMDSGLPEPHTGYGADFAGTSARNDKPARTSKAANPVPTYARGGKVKSFEGMHSHANGGGSSKHATTAGITVGHDGTHVKPKRVFGPAVSPHGSKNASPVKGMHVHGAGGHATGANLGGMPDTPHGGKVSHRARGGRTKGSKGATHVNVIVAPHHGAGAPTPPPMPPGLAGGIHPAMAAPAPVAPPMGAGMPPGGPPPGAPPMGAMMPRKRGGRIHADEAQDKALIKKTLSEEGLIRKARGGGITLTGGADSGIARIEKMKSLEKHPLKPQVV